MIELGCCVVRGGLLLKLVRKVRVGHSKERVRTIGFEVHETFKVIRFLIKETSMTLKVHKSDRDRSVSRTG